MATGTLVTIVDAGTGATLLSGAPVDDVSSWVERSLNLHLAAYSLDGSLGDAVRRLTWNEDLEVVLRPPCQSKRSDFAACRDCPGHAPLWCLENRATLPSEGSEPSLLWLSLGKALVALAPRFTQTLSTMRQFDGQRLGFGEDDGPESLLLGELSFSPDTPSLEFSVRAKEKRVEATARLSLGPGSGQQVLLVVLWGRGAVDWYGHREATLPATGELTVMSTGDAEAAAALRRVLLGPPLLGQSTFKSKLHPHARLKQKVEVRFVRAADMAKRVDLDDRLGA
jgi:hypothetical protein